MVGANTIRNPALVAKMATTLDQISGGRAILGLGAAWFEEEHLDFGIEFGSGFPERLRWLGEALPIIRGMLRGLLSAAISATTSRSNQTIVSSTGADRPSRIPGIERSEREGRVHVSLRRVPEEMGSRSRRDNLHVRALGSRRRPGD
jgi:alkanesulfonate monooxygenase SsuD/methylene tetrahydromethanopterin reductase-like flavin-dependent oxidoreductase (luciferase family)